MRFLKWPIAVLVLLAVAYTVFWFVLAGRSEDWIAAWAAIEPDKDWHATYAATEVSGFPFGMNIRITTPEIVWHGEGQAATWSGAWLVARYLPWEFDRIQLDLPEEQRIYINAGDQPRMVLVQSSKALGQVEISNGRASKVTTETLDAVITVEQNQAPITAGRILVEAEQVDGGQAHDLFVQIDDLGFVARMPEPFSGEVPFLAAALRLTGAVPSGGPVRDRLAVWRDTGGVLDVLSFKLDWPPLDIEADGTVAVDQGFRPVGAFTADIVGYNDLIDALVDVGSVSRNQASIASTVLDVMADQDAETGERRLTVPVTVQNGTLFVGPVPLMPVPPVLPPDMLL